MISRKFPKKRHRINYTPKYKHLADFKFSMNIVENFSQIIHASPQLIHLCVVKQSNSPSPILIRIRKT